MASVMDPKNFELISCEILSAAHDPVAIQPLEINRAANKTAYQASVYSDDPPRKGNDGNFSPYDSDGSCFVINNDNHAWWGVDLQAVFLVQRVVISTRSDWGMTYLISIDLFKYVILSTLITAG